MAGIQVGGLASGMDTESIITQLMSLEQAPRTRQARQQVTVQARQDALRQIDTKLTSLKLAAGDLRSAAIWAPTQSIASGNENVLTARQLAGAAPGGYTVEVTSLASADSRTYAWNGGGSLTIDYTAGAGPLSKTFDLTGMSLDDAVSTINSDGADASYKVAGDATTYSSHTNVASDGLPGVELTFKALGTSTVTVSAPAAKPEDVAAKLKAFVTAYNDAVDFVRGKLNEKRVVNPQSDADAQQG